MFSEEEIISIDSKWKSTGEKFKGRALIRLSNDDSEGALVELGIKDDRAYLWSFFTPPLLQNTISYINSVCVSQ